ncbi:hypothetical protein F6455_10140 [Proteobacteria bacterium 005FR1]|nr:hypothetical protein [Proteobacteria bacterium 005FR1]
MKNTKLWLGAMVVLLSGCGGGGSGSGSGSDHHHEPVHYPPELDAFHVVDSYGVSSEDSPHSQLVLNPYVDGGQFEIYWYATNMDDYTIELRINDRPDFAGSRLISSDYCGPGLDCDRDGIQFCEYFADFSMSCAPPSATSTRVYFDDMVYALPEQLFLILDLCDTRSDSCEFRTREIIIE